MQYVALLFVPLLLHVVPSAMAESAARKQSTVPIETPPLYQQTGLRLATPLGSGRRRIVSRVHL